MRGRRVVAEIREGGSARQREEEEEEEAKAKDIVEESVFEGSVL